MKIKIKQEVEAKFLRVMAGVRYWEDTEVNGVEDTEGDLIPCRTGDLWQPLINMENGKIINWSVGTTAEVHYKVCDQCGYEVHSEYGKVLIKVEDGYVPSILCPKENGHGDYIIMDIDKDGFIKDWDKDDIDSLIQDEED